MRRMLHLSALFALFTLSLPLSAMAQDNLPGIGRVKNETIGDESRIVRYAERTSNTGVQTNWIVLELQSGI